MTKIEVHICGAMAEARVTGLLTVGAVGIPVRCTFDTAWQDLTPTLIATNGRVAVPMVIDADGNTTLPWEILTLGAPIHIGADGWNADGTLRIPTVWANLGYAASSGANADLSERRPDPTPDQLQQVATLAYNADQKAAQARAEVLRVGPLAQEADSAAQAAAAFAGAARNAASVAAESADSAAADAARAEEKAGEASAAAQLAETAQAAAEQSASSIAGKADQLDENTENIEELQAEQQRQGEAIAALEAKIPAQASALNQLADKEFVNSSVATSTAYYISDSGQPFQSLAALESYSGTLTNNDYAFVVGIDSAGNVQYTRYKYSSDSHSWAAEYALNNSSFTAEQWAAISSGITNASVVQIGINAQGIESIREELDQKYVKPAGGIPAADLASGVQENLGKASTALQAVPSTYRTAAAQDVIDQGKQSKAISDAAGYFTTDTVEGALQELGALTSVLRRPEELTWEQIAVLVSMGTAQDKLPVGTMFSNPWVDTAVNAEYDHELHDAMYQKYELADGTKHNGLYLQCHWAHPFGVQFSHQRAFLACPSGLAAGTYYFTIESSWGNNVSAGDVVCFTLTEPVPAGGRISGCEGAPDQAKSNWRIYVWSADGKTQLKTYTPTFTAAGVNLGVQKLSARNGNLNSTQEMAYGWNRWKTSALRQYLNSSGLKGTWWAAQDEWDIRPNELPTKDGFLRGVAPELLAQMKRVKVTTYANTVNDGGVADVTYDLVFPPSLQEMYIAPQISGEGANWDYWKQVNGTSAPWQQYQTYEILKHFAVDNHSSAQSVRLRSANRGNANGAWYVYSSGNVNASSASNAYRFAPACVI